MKYSLYTMGKNISRVSIVLFIIAAIALLGVSRVSAQLAYFSLNPTIIDVPELGEWVPVDVNITGVSDMATFAFKLSYNTTLLDVVEVIKGSQIVPIAVQWLPEVGGVWTPIYDSAGYVWVGCIIQAGSEFTGNATLVTINFTATEVGDCTLHFYDTELKNSMALPIFHNWYDGAVTVISEFPLAVAMPLLLIATLTVTLLGKMFWARKRKDAPTAD